MKIIHALYRNGIVIEDETFKTPTSVDVLTNLRGEVEDLMLNVDVNVECSML